MTNDNNIIAEQPEPAPEVWVFGGNRAGTGDKRLHAWLPVGADLADELWFPAKGSGYVVGSEYTAQVTRTQGRVTLHGAPVYHGRHPDERVRATLEAKHRAASTRLRMAALQRNDKRHSALDASVESLADLLRAAAPADRDAILAYILRRLCRAW